MAHAELCPVCKGKGQLPFEETSSVNMMRPCHGCGGGGWVEVKDQLEEIQINAGNCHPYRLWYYDSEGNLLKEVNNGIQSD